MVSPESQIRAAGGVARRAAQAAVCLAALSVLAVAAALVWPVAAAYSAAAPARSGAVSSQPAGVQDLQTVLDCLTARRRPLVSPAQVQAAVKDTGAAAKLAKKLKFQGIIQVDDGYVAYVQTEEEGLRTLRKGDAILDFVVRDVGADKVVLSLEGVEVMLGH